MLAETKASAAAKANSRNGLKGPLGAVKQLTPITSPFSTSIAAGVTLASFPAAPKLAPGVWKTHTVLPVAETAN